MTEQEQKAFDQMREALEGMMRWQVKNVKVWNNPAYDIAHEALTAANAVSHPKPETTPSPEGWAITSESAANAVSHPQATETSPQKLIALALEGMELHDFNAPEYKISAELLRLNKALSGQAAAPEAHHGK